MQPYHRKLVELTHLLLCNMPHYQGTPEGLKDRDAELCYFLQENTLTNAPEQPDHLIWQEKAEKICEDLGSESTDECYKKFLELSHLVRQVNSLSPDTSARVWKLIFELI